MIFYKAEKKYLNAKYFLLGTNQKGFYMHCKDIDTTGKITLPTVDDF